MAATPGAKSGPAYVYSDTTEFTDGLRKRTMEDTLYSQDPKDLPMRDYFGGYESYKVDNTIFEFGEDTHIAIDLAMGTVSGSDWNNSADTSALPISDSDLVMVGDILMTADGEIVIVSAVGTDTIDVYARGDLGSTESNSNTTADKIYIIGNCQLDGWTYGASPRFTTRGIKKNFTQSFEDTISIQKDYNTLPKWGIKEEFAHQLEQKQLRLAKMLERNVLYGGSNTGTLEGTASHPRTMCGIIAPIASVGTNINIQTHTTDLSAAEITQDAILDEMQEIYTSAGNPDTLMCGPFNKRKISTFLDGLRRTDMEDKKYTSIVNTYECDFGTVNVILNRYMRPSDVLIIEKKNFEFVCKDSFDIVDLPDDRDLVRSSIIGKYSCLLHNEEHASFIYNTSVA